MSRREIFCPAVPRETQAMTERPRSRPEGPRGGGGAPPHQALRGGPHALHLGEKALAAHELRRNPGRPHRPKPPVLAGRPRALGRGCSLPKEGLTPEGNRP